MFASMVAQGEPAPRWVEGGGASENAWLQTGSDLCSSFDGRLMMPPIQKSVKKWKIQSLVSSTYLGICQPVLEWLSWDTFLFSPGIDTIWLYKMVRYVDYLVHAWLLGWVSEGGHSGLILVTPWQYSWWPPINTLKMLTILGSPSSLLFFYF